MKKLLLAFCCLLFAADAPAQNLTSLFELKLYNAQNRLVTGKNVDLYQGATKIYDLTESSSIPGVYVGTVADGEYDIYVNTALWKSGIWIGGNKVSLVTAMFSIDSGANNDTLTVDGHIQADSFSGDGSGLTGIVGSIGESTGDLTIGADSDANGSGELIMRTRSTARGRFANDGRLLLGLNSTNISGTLISGGAISVASDDSNGSVVSLSVGGGTSNLVAGSNGSGSFLPLAFWNSGSESGRFYTDGRFLLGLTSTNISGAMVSAGAISVASDDSNGSVVSLSVGGGTSNLVAGSNGSGSFLPLAFWTNSASRMQIGTDGHVGIGAAAAASVALDVTSTDGALRLPRMTQTQRDALTASNAMAVYSTSTEKFYFRQNAAWDSLGTPAAALIGDTVEVSVFLDSTASNSGSGNSASLTRLGVRRSLTFWSLDDANSDTLLFSLPIPEYADSLEYVVLPYRVNASSGNYYISFSWEFTADDAAVDNSLTYTNNLAFAAPSASASGDWKMYRKTLSPGSAKATGSGRWMDGMLIRVGGNGSDTASGNMDLSTEIMLGWSRKRGY